MKLKLNIRYRIREFKKGMGPRLKEAKFMLRRIKKAPLSIAGIAIIVFFALMAALAPILAPPVTRDPFMIWRDGYSSDPKPPGTPVTKNQKAVELGYATHIFGTAPGQYDIYYGIIWGSITAFRVGIMVVAGALIIGCIIGLISGYYGGLMDEIMMRFTDIIFAFPGLVLAMALVIALPPLWKIDMMLILIPTAVLIAFAIIGSKILKLSSGLSLALGFLGFIVFALLYTYLLNSYISDWTIPLPLNQLDKALIALTIVGWPGYTRLLRGEILRIKQEDYIEAAKSVGCSDLRIMFKHILPNAIYPILISASLDIGGIVLTAAALSFLNIGAPVGYADWGQMISFARNYVDIRMTNWYAFFIPGFFILLFVLGWNLLGDAFRDILDPTLRRR
jgi:peptide/nickel transport system permease protein